MEVALPLQEAHVVGGRHVVRGHGISHTGEPVSLKVGQLVCLVEC